MIIWQKLIDVVFVFCFNKYLHTHTYINDTDVVLQNINNVTKKQIKIKIHGE